MARKRFKIRLDKIEELEELPTFEEFPKARRPKENFEGKSKGKGGKRMKSIKTQFEELGIRVDEGGQVIVPESPKPPKKKETTGKEDTMGKKSPRAIQLQQNLQDLRQKLTAAGLDKASVQERIEILKAAAFETYTLYKKAREVLNELNRELGGEPGKERWRDTIFREEGELAEEAVAEYKRNPFAQDLMAKEAREKREATITKLRSGTIPLIRACEGENGNVALPVRYTDKFTGTPRTRLLRLEVKEKQAEVVESMVPFLRQGIRFSLNPPEFQEVRSPELRKALVECYKEEALTQEILALRTGTFLQLMAGEAVIAAAHHKDWKTPQGRGPVTWAVEGNGQGKIFLKKWFAPRGQLDLTGLIGQEQDPNNPDPELAKLIRYRENYERKMEGRVEPSQEETSGETEETPEA